MMAQTERDDLLFALCDFLFGARCVVVTAGLPGLVCRLIHVSLDLDGDQATGTYARAVLLFGLVRPDPMRLLVESPHQRLQLVGIETSIRVGDYIRAKRWNLIAAAFKQIDVSAAEAIERCLAR
jgi:hypothetical protein